MDTTDPRIIFNESGECNHCTDFLNTRLSVTSHKNKYKDLSALNKVFSIIKDAQRSISNYDVVIGISGGVDSSYTALLAQEAGLRVLAVHMDNGWDTPISVRNIFKLIHLDSIHYQSFVLNWTNFKLIQRAFLEAGVPDIELPTDIAIQSVLHRVASQHRVRFILSGGNIANEGILPASWLYNGRDGLYARSVISAMGYSADPYAEIDLTLFNELKYRLVNGIRTVYPLNYFSYDKKLAKSTLIENFGWEDYGGKHCESTFTRFAQLIYLPTRHNVDYRRAYLSADICLGRISRQHAMEELLVPPWKALNVDDDISFVACKLGYNEKSLKQLMFEPCKWYSDFPNREALLSIVYTVYRFITGRLKASSF
jgi:hypothetical protein